MDTEILEFLKEGEKGTVELRAKFGKYPRKCMSLLLESGAVIKLLIDRKVYWKLADDAAEDIDLIAEALQWAVDNVGTELIEDTEEVKEMIDEIKIQDLGNNFFNTSDKYHPTGTTDLEKKGLMPEPIGIQIPDVSMPSFTKIGIDPANMETAAAISYNKDEDGNIVNMRLDHVALIPKEGETHTSTLEEEPKKKKRFWRR